MELRLEIHGATPYPVCGLFIEGRTLSDWVDALDKLGLDPVDLTVYGLPSLRANEIWGCLVLMADELTPSQLGPLASAHRATSQLIVPANTLLVPQITAYDEQILFGDKAYVLHPEFGLFKLSTPLDLSQHVRTADVSVMDSLRPTDFTIASGKIVAFQLAPSPKEEVERALTSEVTREKLNTDPLSVQEKLRLKLYQLFLTTQADEPELNPTGDRLRSLAEKLGVSGPDAYDKIVADYHQLEERNKKEVDRLLSLLAKDPEAALRYAIPLDEHGYSRGGPMTTFSLQDRGPFLSLFGQHASAGGGRVDLGREFHRLQTEYRTAAEKLRQANKHEKAAYVYLKLLKDYSTAATTLREGKHYEKAALVYLRYLKNERSAAECYEEGSVYSEAIELYSKLKQWEKVGDLCTLQGDVPSAYAAYAHQLEEELDGKSYVSAAKLLRHKLHDHAQAQEVLLRGWDENVDAYNCLRSYLNNISDGEVAWQEIKKIRSHRLCSQNERIFLRVLSGEYAKHDEHHEGIRNMAYELISALLASGKVTAHELLAFNDKNARLRADTLRYELGKGRLG